MKPTDDQNVQGHSIDPRATHQNRHTSPPALYESYSEELNAMDRHEEAAIALAARQFGLHLRRELPGIV